ncbi:acylphosphatase [Segetibacter koreensis]|uniref:acylphosphatase n=1 Tax=Segetibacter koreensis TaxID=398037 RepID=UPI000369C998|nr:acylphosphatase [Segetibacter koreensis]
MPTYHLTVKGLVQGVFYRASAKEIADELGVTGWVRNAHGDEVEAVVTGTEKQLEQFISWCKKGPKKAIVTEVAVRQFEETKFSDFSIKR